MKIVHISDTHGMHRKLRDLPKADVIIHSGDFSMVGTENEILDFLEWFCDLDYPHKIFICGNHEEYLYDGEIGGLDSNVHYLRNSGIEIGGVRFYGVPLFLSDDIYGRSPRDYSVIPQNTDVLVTHCPPYGILDLDDDGISSKLIHQGNDELLESVERVRPKAHLFGHIHRQHGMTQQDGIIFSNGAIMNEDYTALNEPLIIEL